jgi:hypothetical protein
MRHCRLRGSPPSSPSPCSLGPSGPPRRGLSVLPSRVSGRKGEERRGGRRVSQSRRRWTRSCALIKYYVRLTECHARKRRRFPLDLSILRSPFEDHPFRASSSSRVSSFGSSVDRRMATIAGVVVEDVIWPSYFSLRFGYRLPYDNRDINNVRRETNSFLDLLLIIVIGFVF